MCEKGHEKGHDMCAHSSWFAFTHLETRPVLDGCGREMQRSEDGGAESKAAKADFAAKALHDTVQCILHHIALLNDAKVQREHAVALPEVCVSVCVCVRVCVCDCECV